MERCNFRKNVELYWFRRDRIIGESLVAFAFIDIEVASANGFGLELLLVEVNQCDSGCVVNNNGDSAHDRDDVLYICHDLCDMSLFLG